jgi:hypothetical protein
LLFVKPQHFPRQFFVFQYVYFLAFPFYSCIDIVGTNTAWVLIQVKKNQYNIYNNHVHAMQHSIKF